MFLALQVILALGNRPKAEKLTYTISIAVYAFFSLYLIFCTVILTIKAFCPIKSILAEASGSSISVFLGSTYGPIFAGIAGTFGAFLSSSCPECRAASRPFFGCSCTYACHPCAQELTSFRHYSTSSRGTCCIRCRNSS
jgi:hypothetical protein